MLTSSAETAGPMTERRRYRRIPRTREAAVFLYVDERDRPCTAHGVLQNISAGGAAVRAAKRPPAGVTGQLTIQFEGFKLVAEGRVVREFGNVFAIEFTDLAADARDQIDILPDELET